MLPMRVGCPRCEAATEAMIASASVSMPIPIAGIATCEAPTQVGGDRGDPTPNAILRIQRLRDNGTLVSAASCGYAASTNPTDWWPTVLDDPREGNLRDTTNGRRTEGPWRAARRCSAGNGVDSAVQQHSRPTRDDGAREVNT